MSEHKRSLGICIISYYKAAWSRLVGIVFEVVSHLKLEYLRSFASWRRTHIEH